jgi:hypothetical protein
MVISDHRKQRRRRSPLRLDSELVQAARLELALLDSQVAREFRLVASHFLDEAIGVLASDEDVEDVS